MPFKQALAEVGMKIRVAKWIRGVSVIRNVLIDILRIVYYEQCMIKSWANSASKRFYDEGKASKFRGMDCDAADELLASLDAAVSLKDLSPLRSVGLHKLKGDRKGQWAMTVNGPWRICFRFKNGNAFDVEIIDYHRG